MVHHGVAQPLPACHPLVLALLMVELPSLIPTVAFWRWNATQYLGTYKFDVFHALLHWSATQYLGPCRRPHNHPPPPSLVPPPMPEQIPPVHFPTELSLVFAPDVVDSPVPRPFLKSEHWQRMVQLSHCDWVDLTDSPGMLKNGEVLIVAAVWVAFSCEIPRPQKLRPVQGWAHDIVC